MRRRRGAFLCFDFDCDSGLEFHGEVLGEDGDLLDELFDHLSADRTCLLRSEVTVVTLLEIHVQGIGNLSLKALELRPIAVVAVAAIAVVRHSFSPPAF